MPGIRINPWKNRLYITFKNWDQADMPNYVDRLEEACNDLLPGFTCMIVFSGNKAISGRDRRLLIDTAGLISAYGANCVVWVARNTSRLRIGGYPGGQINIPVETASDIESAEYILNCRTDYSVAHEMDYLVFRALNPQKQSAAALPKSYDS